MAVPKRKTSKGRRNRRRSHHKAPAVQTTVCKKCKTQKKPHTTCKSCNTY